MAQMDNEIYKDMEGYKEVIILSNQMIPLYEDMDLFERLEVSGALMNKVSGGAILHLNLGETMTKQSNLELHRMLIEDYNLPHYAINVGSTTCVNGHTTIGIHFSCPECDGEIHTHTVRVVGFDTDTKDWIKQRREWEWKDKGRQFYNSTSKNILINS